MIIYLKYNTQIMTHHHPLKQLVVLAILLVFTFSCQEEGIIEDIDADKSYAEAAEDLVNGFFDDMAADGTEASRLEAARGRSNMAITILRYKDGKLMYASNSDNIGGYNEVNEETVTAYIQPGGYVFWYAAGGLDFLDGIEFDAASQSQLREDPRNYISKRFWLIRIPDDISEGELLKYDILYKLRGRSGIIRLDPKIQVQ